MESNNIHIVGDIRSYYEDDTEANQKAHLWKFISMAIEIYQRCNNPKLRFHMKWLITTIFEKPSRAEYYLLKDKWVDLKVLCLVECNTSTLSEKTRIELAKRLHSTNRSFTTLYHNARKQIGGCYGNYDQLSEANYKELLGLHDELVLIYVTNMYNKYYKYFSDKWEYKLQKANKQITNNLTFVQMPKEVKGALIREMNRLNNLDTTGTFGKEIIIPKRSITDIGYIDQLTPVDPTTQPKPTGIPETNVLYSATSNGTNIKLVSKPSN